jgi:molybdopterin converting factor subunit 1
MIRVEVQYYAILREQAGTSLEQIETVSTTAGSLYAELKARHGFSLQPSQLRVAINGEFAAWDSTLASGARVVFIPPVAGG